MAQPSLGRRRRRVRNGRVTIIRPTVDSDPRALEPREAAFAPSGFEGRTNELGPFRMRDAAQRRYDRLMKAIARLELQAAAARKAEVADAVRWIRRTMARYHIDACEVGA